MSNVKMCNRHKGFFMAGEEGSCTMKVEISRRYDTGESYVQHDTWDFCSRCTAEMNRPTKVDYAAIASMEAEAGIGGTVPGDTGVIPRRPVQDRPQA